MSQATSTSNSGGFQFGNTGGSDSGGGFKIVAVIVAALLVAFIVFRKTK